MSGSALTIALIVSSSAAIAGVKLSSWARTRRNAPMSVCGSPGSSLVRRSLSSAKPRAPCAATTPNSASIARKLFIACVRCLTSNSRERSKAREACCSSLLIATSRMSGRLAAK